MDMESDSAKTSLLCKNGIKTNGTKICLQVIARHLSEKPVISLTNINLGGKNLVILVSDYVLGDQGLIPSRGKGFFF
jgi:hypothetical protein